MNFDDFLEDLRNAHDNLKKFEEQERKLIGEEIKYIKKMRKELLPFSSKKTINGSDALLIYVFQRKKEWISTEAYLTEDDRIAYQVYDEVKYRGYVRDASIENGYVFMTLDNFLRHVPLEEIFQFLLERPDFIDEKSMEKNSKNKERKAFIEKIKNIL